MSLHINRKTSDSLLAIACTVIEFNSTIIIEKERILTI